MHGRTSSSERQPKHHDNKHAQISVAPSLRCTCNLRALPEHSTTKKCYGTHEHVTTARRTGRCTSAPSERRQTGGTETTSEPSRSWAWGEGVQSSRFAVLSCGIARTDGESQIEIGGSLNILPHGKLRLSLWKCRR
uniref:Uncharacterized protein n=1 Tax=Schizaphis graminum TaxID=13262 RepID=A0A2S2NN43_SCHGA